MWQAQGAHNVTPRLGKNAGVLNQTANGKVRSCCGALGCSAAARARALNVCGELQDQVPSARAMPSGPVPVMQRSGPPPQAVGDLAAGNLPAEVERWKKEAEQHKQAAHQLAKVAKSAKQESTDARRLLDEERDKAQRNREESERVIDSLHKQMDELVHSSATVPLRAHMQKSHPAPPKHCAWAVCAVCARDWARCSHTPVLVRSITVRCRTVPR